MVGDLSGMAEMQHIEYLLETLSDPSGRKRWLDYKLHYPKMDLSEGDLSNRALHDYDFSDTNLTHANFFGSDLTRADFSDSLLSGADFRRAVMNNCCLDRADLSMANLQGAVLTDTNIERADLSEARLQGADLVGADLGSSDLTKTDLREASLKYTRLTGAKLDGANVAEADLTGSVMDDDAPTVLRNFDLATVDDRKYRMMKSRIQAPPKQKAEDLEEAPKEKHREKAPEKAEDTTKTRFRLNPFDRSRPKTSEPEEPPKEKSEDTEKSRFRFFRSSEAEETTKQKSEDAEKSRAGRRGSVRPEDVETVVEEAPAGRGSGSARDGREARAEETTTGNSHKEDASHAKPEPERAESNAAAEAAPKSDPTLRAKKAEQDGHEKRMAKAFGIDYVAHQDDLKSDDGCSRVLGIKLGSPYAEVTRAYRTKAKVFHPDKVGHRPKEEETFAREQFHLVKRSYELLTRRRDTVRTNVKEMSNVKWVDGIPRRNSPYEHSLSELQVLVQANPGHESLLYNLAWKYFETGQFDDAISTFERVLAVNPLNEDAQHNLKVVKLQKAFNF